MVESNKRPVLLLALVALCVGGSVVVSVAILTDPTGATLGLTPGFLVSEAPADPTLPALALLAILGIGGLPVLVGLWKDAGWSPLGAFAYGCVLLVWITMQALMIGIVSPLQPVFGTLGLLICARVLATRQE